MTQIITNDYLNKTEALIVDEGALPQVKDRRALTGLRGWNRAKAEDAYLLLAPSLGGNEVHLINLYGQVAHTWTTPYPPGLDSKLTENGTLFHTGKTPGDGDHFISNQPWKGGWVGELDWEGNVLWSVEHPMAHHSAELLRNGNVLLICLEPLPAHVASQVQGGRPGTEWRGTMFGDVLIEMTKDGQEVNRWNLWQTLEPARHTLTAPQEDRTEWTHCNSVVELENGDFLVSHRTISTISIIDRHSGESTWELGAPPLSHQHAPYVLENGNVLVFDNGTHRVDHYLPFSRVLEIDPATKEIVWSYQDPLLVDFYSPLTANAQRLPNGNTLITEATFGRIFEVTADCEVVWEYVSPFFVQPAHNAAIPPTNRLFRSYKYPAADIEAWSNGKLGSATENLENRS